MTDPTPRLTRYDEGSPETDPLSAAHVVDAGRDTAPRHAAYVPRKQMPIAWKVSIWVGIAVIAFALLVLGAIKAFELVAPEPVTPYSGEVEHGAPPSIKLQYDAQDWLYKP